MQVQQRKRYVDPIIYEVGRDISRERYQECLVKIADWFVEWRTTTEPALLARQLFQECLDGVKNDGTPWFSAANSTLAARVRVKCRFDIEKMQPLRKGNDKQRKKKNQNKKRELLKKIRDKKDVMIPDELRKDLQKNLRYGDDPSLWMTSAEHRLWDSLYASYKEQHPELSAVSAMAELKMLCDAHVLMERFRAKQLSGEKVDETLVETTVKRYTLLKKSLGIHPDQTKNKTKGLMDASVGEAVARFRDLGEDTYRNLRERFWVEELVQLWQMYHTPTADGKGYQLDDIGLFGVTRSKPEPCPNCGTMVFAGLAISEIEEYLIRKQAIQPLEDADGYQDETTDTEGDDRGEGVESAGGEEDRSGDDSTDLGEVAAVSGPGPDSSEWDNPPTTPEDDVIQPE